MSRIKIAFHPNFGFEVAAATFVDKSKYEIIPVPFSKKKVEKFGQNMFGEWCYPLKAAVAACEEVIVTKGVEKFIGVNITACSYPLVLGDITKWIDKKFEYYVVTQSTVGVNPASFTLSLFEQFGKAFPDFSTQKALKKMHLGYKRLQIAKKMSNLYYETLPKVRMPQNYKTQFKSFKYELIIADSLSESNDVFKRFSELSKKLSVNVTKYKFAISGDISVISVEFLLLDLDVFLAKQGIQMVVPGLPSYFEYTFDEKSKKAKQIYSDVFSTKHKIVQVSDKHEIEISTLYQLLNALEKKVDGIVYIKPNMCTPCDNLSFVLKKNNFFDYPFVEISYDEHSGPEGILTRLEAFINIVSERKRKK